MTRHVSGPGHEAALEVEVMALERPHPSLLKYYVLESILLGPLFFVALIPLYFRYKSLRYRLDAEGIAMRWGILWRREINLTYARIQDIHLTSNLVERWLGLAKIQVQTASGSSSAEMTIVGLRQFERVRDFLYAKMRGVRDAAMAPVAKQEEGPIGEGGKGDEAEIAAALRAAAAELRALRLELADRRRSAE